MASRIARHPEAFSADNIGGARKRRREKSESYLDWIRTLPCVITGRPAEAAHIRMRSPRHGKRSTGAGERSDDRWAVPLSPEKHRLADDSQHAGGEQAFWRRENIDPCTLALALWACFMTDDREMAEVVIRETRLCSVPIGDLAG